MLLFWEGFLNFELRRVIKSLQRFCINAKMVRVIIIRGVMINNNDDDDNNSNSWLRVLMSPADQPDGRPAGRPSLISVL